MNPDLKLLLSRLVWPSGLVRERACSAISDLLIDPSTRATVYSDLKEWIQTNPLESVANLGLLAIARAKGYSEEFAPHMDDGFFAGMKSPSSLAWNILADINSEQMAPLDWSRMHSPTPSPEYVPTNFFTKNAQRFAPPIFSHMADDFERRTGRAFNRQWSHEFDIVKQRSGTELRSPASGFWGNRASEHYPVYDEPISEVYRSAFLRATAWLVTQGVADESAMFGVAMMACPVDLALWRVSPGRRPDWWPAFEEADEKIDTGPARILERVGALWKTREDVFPEKYLGVAGGIIHAAEQVAYRAEIYGILQACTGAEPPSPEDVIQLCRSQYAGRQFSERSLLRLEGDLKPNTYKNPCESIGHWLVCPIVSRIAANASLRWQYWRGGRGVWVAAPLLLTDAALVECGNDIVVVRAGDETVSTWSDWFDGFTETAESNLPSQTGHLALVSKDLVDDVVQKHSLNYMWVCAITCYHRKHSFSEYDEFEDVRFFGDTRVIRPDN